MNELSVYETIDYSDENEIKKNAPLQAGGVYLEPVSHNLKQQKEIHPPILLNNERKTNSTRSNTTFMWSILANLTQFIMIVFLVIIIILWRYTSILETKNDSKKTKITMPASTRTATTADWSIIKINFFFRSEI
jgi:hypothetical protein